MEIKKFKDYLSDDLKKTDKDIQKVSFETLKDEYEIESVIDIFMSEEDMKKKNEGAAAINLNDDLVAKDIKRGDYVWMTAILKKTKGTSFASPAVSAVIKLRVVEIYKGLKHLNLVKTIGNI